MHRGRSDMVANANAKSDAPRISASEFSPPNLKEKSCELSAAKEMALRMKL